MRIIALNRGVCLGVSSKIFWLGSSIFLNFGQAIFYGGNWAVDYDDAKYNMKMKSGALCLNYTI